jgi:hypothetical protein
MLRRVGELKREAQTTREVIARTPRRLDRKGQELKTEEPRRRARPSGQPLRGHW